jgi:DNA-binding beta-propeller fold protein YncE
MEKTDRHRYAVAIALCACASLAAPAATAAPGTTLPNPFKIVARWTAKSLGLNDPRYFAIAPSGNLYVTDRSQRVSEISPSGKVLRRWGKRGNRRGQFHFISQDSSDPTDISSELAVGPHGKVYVSDSGNARVEVFTAKGRFIRQFGHYGTGRADFLFPGYLVVDASGNVYVADIGRLRKFSPTGKLLWSIGGPGSDPDLVGTPHATAIDSHARLIVVNDATSRIVYLDTQGHKLDAFGQPSDFPNYACTATVDRNGYTYVSGCGPTAPNGTCCAVTDVFDPGHKLVGQWVRSPLATAPVFGPHGEIFAIGWKPGTLRSTAGSILKLAIGNP